MTLDELLTLQPAFTGRDRAELLRKIADEEPRRPRQLNDAIPADLETIVDKVTEKEPADRYASARALADDLGRFLEDKPILAKRPTLSQRAAKWARRHRAVAMAAIVFMLVSMMGLSATVVLGAYERVNIALRCPCHPQNNIVAKRRKLEGHRFATAAYSYARRVEPGFR